MIGDHIEVTVVECGGPRTKLGIKAPPDLPVHRREIYLRMRGGDHFTKGQARKLGRQQRTNARCA